MEREWERESEKYMVSARFDDVDVYIYIFIHIHVYMYSYVYIYIYIHVRVCVRVCVYTSIYTYIYIRRVFANGPGNWGFSPWSNHTKGSKMVLDASLLNTQYFKVRIKGK